MERDWQEAGRRTPRWLSAAGRIGALFVILSTAQAAEDYQQSRNQFDSHYKAKQYREAASAGQKMLAAAEESFRDEPLTIAAVLEDVSLAVYFADVNRPGAAEPLLKRAVAIREQSQGANHADLAKPLNLLGVVCKAERRYDDAEAYFKRALAIHQTAQGLNDPGAARPLSNLARLYSDQSRFAEAAPLFEGALAIRERAPGPKDRDLCDSLSRLGRTYRRLGRYAEADPLLTRARSLREEAFGPEHAQTASSLTDLAALRHDQGRYAEAELLYLQALAIFEKTYGPSHAAVATVLDSLSSVYGRMGRYADQQPLLKRALTIREETCGMDDPRTAWVLNDLANLFKTQGQYDDSEQYHKRALAIREKAYGSVHSDVAASLHNLALLYKAEGRFAEAEPLCRRAVSIYQKVYGADRPQTALSLLNLGSVCAALGRYAEAEPLYQQSLAIYETIHGPDHNDVAACLGLLADLYQQQNRYSEAAPLYRRALAIREKQLGPDHPRVGLTLNGLGSLYKRQGLCAEAAPLYERALKIRMATFGAEHPDVAATLCNLADTYRQQHRYAKAEKLCLESLAIQEKVLGREHPSAAETLHTLARVYYDQRLCDKAVPLIDRAVLLRDRFQVRSGWRFESYYLRSLISWRLGRKNEAVADLKRALDLAEQQRGHGSGAEHERAEFYASFAPAFEQMVAWQVELGGLNDALEAIERGRARSLLDEMNMTGADLNIGRTAAEKERLRQQEAELKARIAVLEKRIDEAEGLTATEQERLRSDLASARKFLYQHYRDERSSNPVYRNLLSVGAGPPRLSQLQRRLAADDGLLLEYLFGEEGGYLLAVRSGTAQLAKLEVLQDEAKTLAIETGPLTAQRLKTILINQENTGVLQQLAHPKTAEDAYDKLAILWRLLAPDQERDDIANGKIKRLLVVPDGPLALLPLEILVAAPGERPRFLLDVGPPILYGPSATVLYNLLEPRSAASATDRELVLTAGNPTYPGGDADAAREVDPLTRLAAGSRYGQLGGKLTPLPYSGWESSWVADVFRKSGMAAVRLDGAEATEANVRKQAAGRRIVHLACHGLTDQSYGNFFGALALAPGKGAHDPTDDGFLTLPEIYELELKGCELVILSACRTNYGPQQQGEGVWTLSRGFLAAGAQRVAASNWLVDDEAAASLVSYFCSIIARGQNRPTGVDYAEALHEAKRWIRGQEKWESPYYWGTFVLVGPN